MKMLICDIIFALIYDPAYKPHTHHSSRSRKPNAHILGHTMAAKHPDLMG